jgi:hypothetical protein
VRRIDGGSGRIIQTGGQVTSLPYPGCATWSSILSRKAPISPRYLTSFAQSERKRNRAWELNSERFQDSAPREVYATLLDEGRYLCSWRSMYRILDEHQEVREHRNQLRHPSYSKPELLATAPNQLWSWDITKLLGPSKWTCYYLYVILDVFSPHVVGLDDSETRIRSIGRRVDLANLPAAGHPTWTAHHSCGSRQCHDVQDGGVVAGRSQDYENPLPSACLQ